MQFPLKARLKNGTPIDVMLATEAHIPALQALYRLIVEEGTSYPHCRPLNDEQTRAYWFEGKTTVGAFLDRPGDDTELIGGFYLKPNWPGRARLVANAGFMVARAWRNKGLGWLLGAIMLRHARDLGYRGVIFNLVFSVIMRHESYGKNWIFERSGSFLKPLSTTMEPVRMDSSCIAH